MKAVSSVFIAALLLLLSFGATFALIYAMSYTKVPPPEAVRPMVSIEYSYKTQYLNVTNEGPTSVTIEGLGFFANGNGYVVPYKAMLEPGQTAPLFLYNALYPNETVVVLTSFGAYRFRLS